MLKLALGDEERRGNRLMAWWNGSGAAGVLQHDDRVLLMERAKDESSLAEMVKNGRDDDASRIICPAAAKLHVHAEPYPEYLIPLRVWFSSLWLAAEQQGGIFTQSRGIAEDLLLSGPKDVVALHGDIHHGNILDFGEKGWLAIDPKGLIGERSFDYANLFCNPNRETAIAPGRLQRQVKVVSEAAGLEPKRLLQWIAAWAGLSSSWAIEDGTDAEPAMTVAGIALNILNDIG